ncbi:MAG: TetR/AcrR family transcriptional regulator [Nocardioidaceae bacterium]|nr:TetR/AcrR family transcriptional regulator [Nocardioidaceae bacterium]
MPVTPARPDRALTPAGERLLDAACELFYARGIRAVGVDEVANVAGTTKKTLYDQFRSKDRLVAAYLRRRAKLWRAFVGSHLDEHAAEPGAERVLAVFDSARAWHQRHSRGCAFVNAWAELGGTDHPGCAVVLEEKRWMRTLFVQLVMATPSADPDLGPRLDLLYEGALVAATAGGQADAFEHARAAAATLLGR